MSWPVQLRDHHGVVHGARLDDYTTVCAHSSFNGAPWGCRLSDPAGEFFYNAEPLNGPRCPICYPDGDQ